MIGSVRLASRRLGDLHPDRLLDTRRCRPAGIGVCATDISDRVEAENEVRRSEARFRAVVENMPAAFSIRDAAGRFPEIDSLEESRIGRLDLPGAASCRPRSACGRRCVREAAERIDSVVRPISDIAAQVLEEARRLSRQGEGLRADVDRFFELIKSA